MEEIFVVIATEDCGDVELFATTNEQIAKDFCDKQNAICEELYEECGLLTEVNYVKVHIDNSGNTDKYISKYGVW